MTLNKRQCEQRRRLVSQIESRDFEAVVEEVAYTWFNENSNPPAMLGRMK